MKTVAAIVLIMLSGAVQAKSTAGEQHYPKGIYHCVDEKAGNYLLQIGPGNVAAMVDAEDIGELRLAYITARDKINNFTATMNVEGDYIGKVTVTPTTALISFPDNTVAKCDNKRPVNAEEYPE